LTAPLIDVLRQLKSGHRASSASRRRKSGLLTLLKNGGPTDIFTPVTASDRRGKIVPQNVAKHNPTRIMLLYKNELSFEI
jgi:hypothetical protein